MATLTSRKASEALKRVQSFASETTDEEQFMSCVDKLVRAVQDETERAYMRRRVRQFGEPYMVMHRLSSAISLCMKPMHREAAITEVKTALGEYLGLDFIPPKQKRRRRKLLPRR